MDKVLSSFSTSQITWSVEKEFVTVCFPTNVETMAQSHSTFESPDLSLSDALQNRVMRRSS